MLLRRRFGVAALIAPQLVFSVPYTQSDSHTSIGFFESFSFQAISDPTHGPVDYVDAETAANENLTYASADHFVLRTDHRSVHDPDGPGRKSVRIQSLKQYTTSVMIIALLSNCDVVATSNVGCGVKFVDTRSYGPMFNEYGGGWYAIERTNYVIKIWFWSRDAVTLPNEVEEGAININTDSWGGPAAYFSSTSCDIASKFGPHNIVINLDFCGDWAGSSYRASGYPSTCVDYVNNNPSAFEDAYFDSQWLKIYT
ncbi:glycoside hydrolase family 16 protein [Collybiopsis luxurians FD-317 M1]|nr:glycoside hydrolase family 16 protein [Collybiopsis luxurians FD-317 M1]